MTARYKTVVHNGRRYFVIGKDGLILEGELTDAARKTGHGEGPAWGPLLMIIGIFVLIVWIAVLVR